jgi:hypothetical protein
VWPRRKYRRDRSSFTRNNSCFTADTCRPSFHVARSRLAVRLILGLRGERRSHCATHSGRTTVSRTGHLCVGRESPVSRDRGRFPYLDAAKPMGSGRRRYSTPYSRSRDSDDRPFSGQYEKFAELVSIRRPLPIEFHPQRNVEVLDSGVRTLAFRPIQNRVKFIANTPLSEHANVTADLRTAAVMICPVVK